jgi:hypothetical protein
MCCGRGNSRSRNEWTVASASRATIPPRTPATTVYEYVGRTRLVVTGPVTGRQYRFERSGARLAIDPRDRTAVAAVPNLRPIGGSTPRR